MSDITVRVELETRLKTWADAQTPKIPIAFENVAFTKPTSGAFLEVFIIPNDTISREVGATKTRSFGIFQINCWAKSGTGMRAVEQLAQAVSSLYPVVPKTGAVSIDSPPSSGRRIDDPSGWVIIPVTIKYRYED